MTSCHRQAAARRALDSGRRSAQRACLGRPSSRPSGVLTSAAGTSWDMTACEYNGSCWNSVLWNSQDSSNNTETSDEEEEYSTYSEVHGEPAPASAESSSKVGVDYAASKRFVNDLFQRHCRGLGARRRAAPMRWWPS